MLKIGILGAGRIGQVHARTLMGTDQAEAIAVADTMPAAAQALADKLKCDVRSVDEIIAAPDIDAVIIGTPTSLHYEQIHACANAGKAVFCEKPVDLSTERTAECVAICDEKNVPFFVAFNRRFDPNFSQLHDRLRAGEIGDVEIISILSRDPGPPPIEYLKKGDGGLFRDMTIHDFDMANFLMAEPFVSVYATGAALVDPEVGKLGDVDTAAVLLTTASGKICQISNSRRATYGYDQRVEVHGSKGLLKAENILESSVISATEAGFKTSPAQHFFLERYEAAYRIEMLHFIDCVNSGTKPTPGGADGLAAQRLADAASKSRETGQVVQL